MKMINKSLIVFIQIVLWVVFYNTAIADELVVTEDGKVGIGIASPVSRMQIVGQNNPVPLQIGRNDGTGSEFTIDIAAGQGLANLVAGARINSSGSGYEFLGARGASRIMLHDGSISFFTSSGTAGTAGSAVDGFSLQKMVIFPNGNVGIGTNNPSSMVDIVKNSTESQFLKLRNTVSEVRLAVHNGYADIGVASNHDLRIIANDSEKIRVAKSGNIGIGTTTPAAKLHILSPASDTVSVQNSSLYLRGSNQGYGVAMGTRLSSGGAWIQGLVNDSGGYNLLLNPSGGNVGIGTAAPQQTLDVAGTIKASQYSFPNGIWKSNGAVGIGTTSPTEGITATDFYTGIQSTIPIKLHVAGNLKVNGKVFDSSNQSDIRLKKNIEPITDALDKIAQIRGVSYDWIDKSSGTARELGVIAQDVEAVFPELVLTESQGFKSVEYKKLVAPLIEAVKALKTEVETLQDENAQLASENQALKQTHQNFEERLAKLEQMISKK